MKIQSFCEQEFFEFLAESSFFIEPESVSQQLGFYRRTTLDMIGSEVLPKGSCKSIEIDSCMKVKSTILKFHHCGGDERRSVRKFCVNRAIRGIGNGLPNVMSVTIENALGGWDGGDVCLEEKSNPII